MLTAVALLAFSASPYFPYLLSFYGKIPTGIFLAVSSYYDAKKSAIALFWKPLRLRNFRSPFYLALYLSLLQVIVLFTLGVFIGFGKSPYSFTPLGILTNFAYVTSSVVGLELSRAYFVKMLGRKLREKSVLLTAILYFLILSYYRFFNFPTTPVSQLEFLGKNVIPVFTQQLFLCLLAYVYGAKASLAFAYPTTAFEWFSPILPNIDWTLNSLVTTAIPALGYSILESELQGKKVKVKARESETFQWTVTLTAMLLLFLFFTGSFGYHPSVVGSGSMQPAISTGDVVIVKNVRPEEVAVGDVIQYWSEDGKFTITHRVIEIIDGEERIFITKGDANEVADDPINEDRVIGKVVFVLPKVGIPALLIRDLLKLWGVLR